MNVTLELVESLNIENLTLKCHLNVRQRLYQGTYVYMDMWSIFNKLGFGFAQKLWIQCLIMKFLIAPTCSLWQEIVAEFLVNLYKICIRYFYTTCSAGGTSVLGFFNHLVKQGLLLNDRNVILVAEIIDSRCILLKESHLNIIRVFCNTIPSSYILYYM